MMNAIYDVTNAIDESTLSIAEFKNEMRQIRWDAFDDALETVKRINSESDFYIDLMSNKNLVDDEGNFTEYGKATLALHQLNYKNYLAQADAYAKEYQEIMSKVAKGELSLDDENVQNRLRELEELEWSSRLDAENERQSGIDLIRQSYEAQLNTLSNIISKYKELKQSEKDAYEYQKKITEKTKNIAALQKQLSAYSGNNTEEARAKIQKLKVELESATEDLKETEYEKYLSDMNDMADGLYADFEDFIDEKLNNTNDILGSIQELIGDKNGVIYTLNSLNAGITENGKTTASLADLLSGKSSSEDFVNNTVSQEKAAAEAPQTASTDNTMSNYVEVTGTSSHDSAEPFSFRENMELNRIPPLNNRLPKQTAIDFIKSNVQKAEAGKSYSDINKVIQKNEAGIYKGTGKVLSSSNLKLLASELGVTYDNAKKTGNLYKKLKSLGIKGFETGSRNTEKDQLAWTQENGGEIIYRASDGAILTPLGRGDKVFTNEMSEKLWQLAQMNPVQFKTALEASPTLPALEPHVNGGDVNIDIGDIILPDVQNPEQFSKQLLQTIADNSKVQRSIQSVSVDLLSGNSSFNAKRFK